MTDKEILRELAEQYALISRAEIQDERRRLWRAHNSLKPTRPLIYTRAFAWKEMPEAECLCRDPFLRSLENNLRHKLFWYSLGDDSIFEPWLDIPAVYRCYGMGVEYHCHRPEIDSGSFKQVQIIEDYVEDMKKLRMPFHAVDERATAEKMERVHDAVGDAIALNCDRSTAYRLWDGDIAMHIGYLRGIEPIMYDMIDQPENLHRLLAFLRDAFLQVYRQAEAAGDLGYYAHENQAMPYAEELHDPVPDSRNVRLNELWYFAAAQEYTLISPEMHDEFLLRYQLPVMSLFGLVAYGCCEDLTRKIDLLRKIPNLRRIAVSPFADSARCAEQIGGDYVLSYRPNPSTSVSNGFAPERIRTGLADTLRIFRANGCLPDITLKDIETVEHDPSRVRSWVTIARETIDKVW